MSAGVSWLVLTSLLQAPRTQLMRDTDKRQEEALEGGRGPSSPRRRREAERRGCCEWHPGWRHRPQRHHPLTVPQACIHLSRAAEVLWAEGRGWAGRRYSPWWAGGSSHPLGQKRETAGWGCCPCPSSSHTPPGRRASREPGPAPEGGSGRR